MKCNGCGKEKSTNEHQLCKSCGNLKHGDSHESFYYSWQQLKLKHNIYVDYQQLKDAFFRYYQEGAHIHAEDGVLYLMSKADISRLMRTSARELPTGVYYNKKGRKYYWQLNLNNKAITGYGWVTPEEAADSRDSYILEHNITARLTDGTANINSSLPTLTYQDTQ
jgi:ribosomal protein L37E